VLLSNAWFLPLVPRAMCDVTHRSDSRAREAKQRGIACNRECGEQFRACLVTGRAHTHTAPRMVNMLLIVLFAKVKHPKKEF
jgi:hypothetical protein